MIELDIDRMFEDPNDPALGIVVRFNSLERYLELLLEFTPHIQDQTLVRFEADLARKAKSLSSEDMHIELEGVKEEIEQLIPTSFYGAFVLALFAALESSVTDIANYVRGRELSSLALSDLREQNTIKRLSLYLETMLRQPLLAPASVLEGIRKLQVVRNVLAHANGSLSGQRNERREELERLCATDGTVLIENNSLVVTAQFLSSSLAVATAFLNLLLAQLATCYPTK